MIQRWRRVPRPLRALAPLAMAPLGAAGVLSPRLSQRLREVAAASDARTLRVLYTWIRPEEHAALLRPSDADPVDRLFERTWASDAPRGDRLAGAIAHATEIDVRLVLANDYLFKVDLASMREGLEVRVPMLDEELFAFGLSLPIALRRRGRTAKLVLREVAARWLPREVAVKPKWGFSVPVDKWLGPRFRTALRDYVIDRGTPIADYLEPSAYEPIVHAFADGVPVPGVSRAGMYTRAIMLLALQAHLVRARESAPTEPRGVTA
jgi:asparagine synthase (glutamine-hydrolysing)